MAINTTKRSLADLAAAFDEKTTSSDNANQTWKLFFNFWKAPVDTVSTVRFLPDSDPENPRGFLVENLVHELEINGKREKVACGKMYGEHCPICDLSAEYYNKKSPLYDEEIGQKLYKKKSYISQALVLETPIEQPEDSPLVWLIEFGPQIYKQIQAGFKSGDLDNSPIDLKGGYNFRFRKTLNGNGSNSYTTSNFSPKQSDVSDELIEQIELYDLKEYRQPEVSTAVLETMLAAAMNSLTGGGHVEVPKAAPVAAKATVATATKVVAPTTTISSDDNPATGVETQPVVQQTVAPAADAPLTGIALIRARAAAAKAAANNG